MIFFMCQGVTHDGAIAAAASGIDGGPGSVEWAPIRIHVEYVDISSDPLMTPALQSAPALACAR